MAGAGQAQAAPAAADEGVKEADDSSGGGKRDERK